jgi:hypothetical protein
MKYAVVTHRVFIDDPAKEDYHLLIGPFDTQEEADAFVDSRSGSGYEVADVWSPVEYGDEAED